MRSSYSAAAIRGSSSGNSSGGAPTSRSSIDPITASPDLDFRPTRRLGLTCIVSFAGVTAPIAYLLGGLICLLVAIVLTQLAKGFNGAGGYFLCVSKTIGPRPGWLTTWLYFLYDPVAVASVCAF